MPRLNLMCSAPTTNKGTFQSRILQCTFQNLMKCTFQTLMKCTFQALMKVTFQTLMKCTSQTLMSCTRIYKFHVSNHPVFCSYLYKYTFQTILSCTRIVYGGTTWREIQPRITSNTFVRLYMTPVKQDWIWEHPLWRRMYMTCTVREGIVKNAKGTDL